MTSDTPLDLDAIETRAASLHEYAILTDQPFQAEADQLTGTDVPALIETVRRLREQLALAAVLEIPRPGHVLPLQLQRSYGHTDRWAICDREGRRWHREHGWVFEAQGIRDEAQRGATRFTLAEAQPLAEQIASAARPAAAGSAAANEDGGR